MAVVKLKSQIKSDDAQIALATKEQADINGQVSSALRDASRPAHRWRNNTRN